MTSNKIRSTYQCEIELLTPLHIGSGDTYVENFDFFHEKGGLLVFDRKRLLQLVADAGEKTIVSFTNAVEEGELGTWLKRNKIDMEQTLIHTFPCRKAPRDINVQLRDGTGHPLLAGSSLKGAFRTAILARLSDEDSHKSVGQATRGLLNSGRVNLQFADSQICNEFLGKDAQNNLMRSLSVTDAVFEKDCAKLQQIEISRLVNDSTMKDKNFSLYVEKIPQGAASVNQISFDNFLAEKGQNHLGFRTCLTLEWLLKAVQRKTDKTIETELDFLENISGNRIKDMQIFYQGLRDKAQQQGENEVILQLAWGSGWNGMTGQLLDKKQLTPQLRRNLQLAPQYIQFPFPKSRRVAVIDGQTVPMGWVRLKFTSKEEFRRQESIRLAKKMEKAKSIQAEQKEKARIKQVWDALSEQEQELAIVRGDEIARVQASNKRPIADIWPGLKNAESEHQKNLAQAFYSSWQERPDRWRKKECSPSQWKKVKKVVELLGIVHDDILQISAEDEELTKKIKDLDDWNQCKNSGINFSALSLNTAELLARRFQNDWGCSNKKAKKDKKQAWKELQKRLAHLRKESAATAGSGNA